MDTTPTPVAPESNTKNFLKRELSGATFLTLEHIAHMALVVLVTILVTLGVGTAVGLWFGLPAFSPLGGMSMMLSAGGEKAFMGAMGLSCVAALLVLAPALFILDRRTRAEWHKRPGYAARLAYKVPVYTALGVLSAVIVALKIQLLSVIITSFAYIGVPDANIGSMYINQFVPALLSLLFFAAAWWYVFSLAKGRDNGRMFSTLWLAVAAMLSVALFITAIVVMHDGKNGMPSYPESTDMYNSDYYRDMLRRSE